MPSYVSSDKEMLQPRDHLHFLFTSSKMADLEYTDDETEYDSPSNSQAVLMVSLSPSSCNSFSLQATRTRS